MREAVHIKCSASLCKNRRAQWDRTGQESEMKKHESLLIVLLLLCSTGIAVAQDIIVKRDNTTVLSKVLEVTSTEIKYKKWSNQDGPTYSISRSEVTSINYQNGDVDKFTDNAVTTPAPQPTVTYPQPQTQTTQTQSEPKKPKSPYSRGKEVQFSLHGGVALPVGDFGITDNNTFCAPFSFGSDELETGYGAAKTGFNASMKFHVPVYSNDKDIIGIPTKFNVMFNGFTDSEKRAYREQWQTIGQALNEQYGSNAYQFQVTKYSNYLNYSLMGGVDYTHYFSKSFGLFAEANIGLNVSQITSSNMNNLLGGNVVFTDYQNHIEYHSGDGMEVSYKAKASFAYEFGGGLFLFDHLSIGVFYTGCTPFQVSPTWHEYFSYSLSNGNNESYDEITAPKLRVSALSIQLGVHF